MSVTFESRDGDGRRKFFTSSRESARCARGDVTSHELTGPHADDELSRVHAYVPPTKRKQEEREGDLDIIARRVSSSALPCLRERIVHGSNSRARTRVSMQMNDKRARTGTEWCPPWKRDFVVEMKIWHTGS